MPARFARTALDGRLARLAALLLALAKAAVLPPGMIPAPKF
jgi:hypothetical protein